VVTAANKALVLVNNTTINTMITTMPVKATSVRVNNKASAAPVEVSTTLNDLTTAINPAAVLVKAMSAPRERKPPTSAVTIVLRLLIPVPICTIEAEDDIMTLKFWAQLALVLELALALPQLDITTTITELVSVNKGRTTITLASDLATLMELASVNKVNKVLANAISKANSANTVSNSANKVSKVNWVNKANKAPMVVTPGSADLRVEIMDLALVNKIDTTPARAACKVVTSELGPANPAPILTTPEAAEPMLAPFANVKTPSPPQLVEPWPLKPSAIPGRATPAVPATLVSATPGQAILATATLATLATVPRTPRASRVIITTSTATPAPTPTKTPAPRTPGPRIPAAAEFLRTTRSRVTSPNSPAKS
jgi:hypothetical protein